MNNKGTNNDVLHCIWSMNGLRDSEIIKNTKEKVEVVVSFGRNGHGYQSDYLHAIAKVIERMECYQNLTCTVKNYKFDTLDDVGSVTFSCFIDNSSETD